MKSLCAILGVLTTAIVVAACGGGGTTTVIEKTVSTTPASSGSASTPQDALKAYDLAWAEGDAEAACELLVDSGRKAVETEMSNRTLGGLPLNCPERMEEVLQLLGPEAVAQLDDLADKVSSDKVSEHGDIAEITVNPAVFMELKEVGGSWYINGSTITEIEPLITRKEVEEAKEQKLEEAEEELAEMEPAESPEEHAREQEGEGKLKEEAATIERRAEEATAEGLEARSGEAVTFTECPLEVPTPGATFICDAATESGKHYQAEFEVLTNGSLSVPIRIYLSHEN